ncbi:hypothetical protein SDRG_10416 [Saprolegnia diclina VS20]|uniref:Uncharacterized protein n=1 Tax=Saprolegnia diclina (strain VS20) TaxID=1156394 RepID=T0RHW4_SAPDV|nr:hypothetical protein SDRG_10416 [Saprolegnia diclina VS20]EQC31898.1 hypothetical protein SDRG_10416 [Saprolegnia diclina VS20]|eukprot:XP_008614626.1 hypothetical protein SDRG_10416 [Saprolegnia diclina VS20]
MLHEDQAGSRDKFREVHRVALFAEGRALVTELGHAFDVVIQGQAGPRPEEARAAQDETHERAATPEVGHGIDVLVQGQAGSLPEEEVEMDEMQEPAQCRVWV